MEFVVGPVVALLLAMKFNVYKTKKTEERIQVLENKVELHSKQQSHYGSYNEFHI